MNAGTQRKMFGRFSMRRSLPVLLAIAALLTKGWVGASSASQDCCHSAGTKSNKVSGHLSAPVAPMAPLNATDVRKLFNDSSKKVRVVALLSPTCPGCQSGHAIVGKVLKKFPSQELQTIFVWEPMRDGDDAASATRQAATIQDPRISQGWDGSRNLGNLFAETLDLHETAWDVYLVYKPGIKWDETEPPHPTFWMHQLQGVDPGLLLCVDPNRLGAGVGKLLRQTN